MEVVRCYGIQNGTLTYWVPKHFIVVCNNQDGDGGGDDNDENDEYVFASETITTRT